MTSLKSRKQDQKDQKNFRCRSANFSVQFDKTAYKISEPIFSHFQIPEKLFEHRLRRGVPDSMSKQPETSSNPTDNEIQQSIKGFREIT